MGGDTVGGRSETLCEWVLDFYRFWTFRSGRRRRCSSLGKPSENPGSLVCRFVKVWDHYPYLSLCPKNLSSDDSERTRRFDDCTGVSRDVGLKRLVVQSYQTCSAFFSFPKVVVRKTRVRKWWRPTQIRQRR